MVSHGERWRDSCPARGVTHLAIGSSDWLGLGIEFILYAMLSAVTYKARHKH